MAFNQPLAGRIEPPARTWRQSSAADRLAFYRAAGEAAVRLKRAELARAIGANGRRMRPRKHPRRDGAAGPVLTPHDGASRTARLMAVRATAAGVTLYWHSGIRKGQRTAWGTILGFHAAGVVRGAPARDVRLSTRGVTRVRTEMAAWWTGHLRRKPGPAAQDPAPRPSAVRRLQEALVAKYRSLAGYFRKPGEGF